MVDGSEILRPGQSGAREMLAAHGTVGIDLLAVDWESTRLGPPDEWPQSLVTAVEIMLGSRFSMWMLWGDEKTFFCNDAYRRNTLGEKYPWALGRPADQVWSEIWNEIGPRIERVLRDGQSTWDVELELFLNRDGYKEETHHTFSYSPLHSEDGEICGMLCVVAEETERVVGRRQFETLRELAERTMSPRSERELFALADESLAVNRKSVPWLLVYRFTGEGDAELVMHSGAAAGLSITPPLIEHGDPAPAWPLEQIQREEWIEQLDLAERFDDMPTGDWDIPPERAVIANLRLSDDEPPYGFMVAATNPYHLLKPELRRFVGLLARTIAAGLRGARAYVDQRERADAYAELNRAKTEFFTNVSHELRTPLTLMLGPAADMLTDDAEPLPAAQRARLEVIDRNSQRILTLVNNLLDFARIDTGLDRGAFAETAAGDFTASVAAMFESTVESAGLSFDVRCQEAQDLVFIDREMWTKIVMNLVSNALKFTPAGTITVETSQQGSSFLLEVSDSGIGIAESEQETVFERFHRVPAAAAESPEGSGVGLSLVSDLTMRHGGEVRLASALGEGSKFTVEIPVGRSHLDDDEIVVGDDGRGQAVDRSAIEQVVSARRWHKASGLDSAPPAPQGRGEGLRVLIVEDNPDLRGYLVQMLAADYAVEAVGDGHQAVEAVLRDPPDLVITDVVMPNVDGLELLAKLRADERTLQIPVMMLSARGGEEAMVGGLEAGADDYLVKPFTARELRARVAAVLELDRTRRAHTALERKSTLLEEAQMMAKLGSWEYDPQTGSVQVTDETLRILGLDTQPGSMPLEQLMEEHVAPEYRNEVRLALQDAIRDRPFSIEIKILNARGEERLIRCAGRRAEDQLDDGPRVRGSAQDITEQVAIRTERLIADTLQRSLLPERAFTSSRLEVVGEYLPGVEGTQVGGDWFDVIELDPDRTALVIGDVMGRGIAAASAMGKMRTAIRAYARLGLPPTEVVRMLDELVAELVDEQLVTMIFGVHDAAAGSFTWVNAGHLPPVLRSGQDARMLATADSPPIVPGAPLPERTQREVQIGPGDLLVLYTDGLVERREGSIDDEFERLVGAVGRAEGTARQMSSSVLAALGADGSGDDDIALLIAHVLR